MVNPSLSPKQLDWLKEIFQATGQSAGVKALEQAENTAPPKSGTQAPPPPAPPTSTGNAPWRKDFTEVVSGIEAGMDQLINQVVNSLDMIYDKIASNPSAKSELVGAAGELRRKGVKDVETRISSTASWRKNLIALCKNTKLSVDDIASEAEKIASIMEKVGAEWASDKFWLSLSGNPYSAKLNQAEQFRIEAAKHLREAIKEMKNRARRD